MNTSTSHAPFQCFFNRWYASHWKHAEGRLVLREVIWELSLVVTQFNNVNSIIIIV
jgi:hypothetical protein